MFLLLLDVAASCHILLRLKLWLPPFMLLTFT